MAFSIILVVHNDKGNTLLSAKRSCSMDYTKYL
jgi:hypothetical protein